MRRAHTDEQTVKRMLKAWEAIPVRVVEHRDWDTPEAEQFVALLNEFRRKGGSVKNLNAEMGLTEGIVHQVARRAALKKHKARLAARRQREGAKRESE